MNHDTALYGASRVTAIPVALSYYDTKILTLPVKVDKRPEKEGRRVSIQFHGRLNFPLKRRREPRDKISSLSIKLHCDAPQLRVNVQRQKLTQNTTKLNKLLAIFLGANSDYKATATLDSS
jgi:hypothetical protein